MAIIDITQPWDGHEYLEVEEYIKAHFKTLESRISSIIATSSDIRLKMSSYADYVVYNNSYGKTLNIEFEIEGESVEGWDITDGSGVTVHVDGKVYNYTIPDSIITETVDYNFRAKYKDIEVEGRYSIVPCMYVFWGSSAYRDAGNVNLNTRSAALVPMDAIGMDEPAIVSDIIPNVDHEYLWIAVPQRWIGEMQYLKRISDQNGLDYSRGFDNMGSKSFAYGSEMVAYGTFFGRNIIKIDTNETIINITI